MITLDDFDDFPEKKKLRWVSYPGIKYPHALRGWHFHMISEAEKKIQFSKSKSKLTFKNFRNRNFSSALGGIIILLQSFWGDRHSSILLSACASRRSRCREVWTDSSECDTRSHQWHLHRSELRRRGRRCRFSSWCLEGLERTGDCNTCHHLRIELARRWRRRHRDPEEREEISFSLQIRTYFLLLFLYFQFDVFQTFLVLCVIVCLVFGEGILVSRVLGDRPLEGRNVDLQCVDTFSSNTWGTWIFLPSDRSCISSPTMWPSSCRDIPLGNQARSDWECQAVSAPCRKWGIRHSAVCRLSSAFGT